MNNRRLITAVMAAAAMLVLILDSKTAITGVSEGIDLCIRTLIPSLFPFLVVSSLLTSSLAGQAPHFLHPLGVLCGIPTGAESILAVGLLGGYPVGAGSVAEAYRTGSISRQDAERMLSFCNNAGPSFLFGIVGPMFENPVSAWILWAIHIFSAMAVGMITAEKTVCRASRPSGVSISFPKVLEQSIRTMAIICGWVTMFRMVLVILDRWILWVMPKSMQVIVAGILELSNGCVQLELIDHEGTRFLIAGIILALGGLCVAMQTVSVTKGLSLRYYIPGKMLQCGISVLLCLLVQGIFPIDQRCKASPSLICAAAVCTAAFGIVMQRSKKRSSNPTTVGV